MQENTETPTVGKDANRKREIEFFDSVAEFHGAEVLASAAGDDVTFSERTFEVTFKNGNRVKLEQATVRRWKDGQIVRERFYYNAG
jgi:ketosteroid isomerase-like protein